MEPVFENYISKEEQSLRDRVSFRAIDFFKDHFPSDVNAILFGNVLHDWDDSIKKLLIQKTFDSLPKGGYIVIYDFFLDEEKKKTTDNFLMSLHMQLAATGSQFSFSEMSEWLT